MARIFARASLPAGLLLSASTALAGPTGGQVTAGRGEITRPDADTTLINQQSSRMAVDWTRFNISQQELVRFEQPSSSASALNHIYDQNPSQIHGRLQANGQVLLVNPNGVFFSPTARVNVGSLVASGLDIDTDDFMAGNYNFQSLPGREGGLVVNQGILQAATGGSVSLIGGAVKNEGVILATAGQVNLAAGRKVTMDFDGDGLIRFAVDEEVVQNAHDLDSAVSNSGEIRADGGSVLLSGRAARDVFSNVVNNEGIVRAGRIENQGGSIRLVAGGSGSSIVNTGSLDAAGQGGDGGRVELQAEDMAVVASEGRIDVSSDAGRGGEARVLGDRVGLMDLASIDAAGPLGGGKVLIGGDYQGGNPDINNAARTYVGPDASISADATASGDGGKVIVWSDEVTGYYGDISARGGHTGGDGGFVEVSGKELLAFDGRVDVSAPQGGLGTVLLDPRDITIEAAGASVNDGELADDQILFTEGLLQFSTNFSISNSAINGLTGNVILQANRDITQNALADISLTTDTQTLTLQAGRHITLNAAITTTNGAVHLEADSSHSSDADLLGAALTCPECIPADGDGTLTIAENIDTTGGAGTGAKITLIGSDFDITATSIDAGVGDINIAHSSSSGAASLIAQDLTLGGVGQLSDVEIDALASTGTVTLGRATTAGDDGAGTGSQTLTNNLLTVDGTITTAASTAGRLTLLANDDINVNSDLTTAGNITLTADDDGNGAGDVTMGVANTLSTQGGDLTITGNTITLGALTTTGTTDTSGGTVIITAVNSLSVAGAISADGGAASADSGGANAGDITLTADGGNLDLTGVSISAVGAAGNDGGAGAQAGGAGGAVTLDNNASGDSIIVGDIDTSGGAANETSGGSAIGGDAGAVSLTTVDTAIAVGNVTAAGGAGAGNGGGGGAGGTVTLQVDEVTIADTDIGVTGTIDTTGGDSSGAAAGGTGGDVLIRVLDSDDTGDGDVAVAAIDTSGGSSDGTGTEGDAGSITLISDEDAALTAGQGDMTLNGTLTALAGSGGGTPGNNNDIVLDAGASLISTGGTLSGDLVDITAGIDIGASGTEINTAANNLILNAGGDIYLEEADAVTLDTATAGGLIDIDTLAAGGIELEGAVTAGTTVDISTFDGSILDSVSNGNGPIVGTTITLDASTGTGSVGAAGNALTISGTDLAVSASGEVVVNTTVNNVAVDTTAAGAGLGTVTVSDTDALNVGTIGGVTGISVSLDSAIDVSAGGLLTVDDNIATTGTGTIDLTGVGVTLLTAPGDGVTVSGEDGTLTVDTGAGILTLEDELPGDGDVISLLTTAAGTGDINLTTGDLVIEDNESTGADQIIAGGTLTIDSGTAALNLGDDAPAGGFNLDDSEMDALVTSGALTLGSSSTGNIILDRAAVFTGDLSLITGSFINDNSVGTAFQSTGTLTLTSDGAVGSVGNTLATDVGSLTITDTGGNAVFVTDAGTGGDTTYNIGTVVDVGNVILVQSASNLVVGDINAAGSAVTLEAIAGNINDGAAGTEVIAAQDLAMNAGTGIIGLNTAVTNLAAETKEGNLEVANTGSLTIAVLGSLDGLTITDTAGNDLAEDIIVTASSPLVIDADVVNNDGGDIILAAEGTSPGDSLTINAGITIQTAGGAGAIELYAGDIIQQLSGSLVDAASTGTVDLFAGTDYAGGTPVASGVDGSIIMAADAVIASDDGDISLQAPNDIAIGAIDADENADSTAGNVSVSADSDGSGDGAISDAGGDGITDITAAGATLTAATGIGAGDAIDTTADTVEFNNSDAGDVMIASSLALTTDTVTVAGTNAGGGAVTLSEDTGSLTVGSVGGETGITTDSGAVTIDVTAADELLTVSQAVSTTNVPTGAGITLTADAMTLGNTIDSGDQLATLRAARDTQAIDLGGADAAGTLGLDAADLGFITSSGGLTIGSAGSDGGLTVSAAVDLDTPGNLSGGSLTLQQDSGAIAFNDTLTSPLDTTAVTATGSVSFDADGAISAAGQNVTLTASGGAITGDAAAFTNVTAADVSLTADTGIGAADAIETIVDTASFSNGSNAVRITNTQATGLTVDGGNGAGITTIEETSGDLTVGAAGIITSGAVNLTASNTTALIDFAAAGQVDTSAGGGAITLTADDMALDNADALASLVAGAGLVTLQPQTPGQAIDIGTNTGLGLTAAELAEVSGSGGLTIGNTSGTGGITVSAAVDLVTPGNLTGGVLTLLQDSGAIAFNDTLTSPVDTTASTAGGNISFDADGAVSAAGQSVTLAATLGAITGDAADFTNVTAADASLSAATGIGATDAIQTDVDSVIATVNSGNLALDENDAITLTDLTATDGSIIVDAGGDITATDVLSSTDSPGNDITITSTGGGVAIDSISAGNSNGVVTVDAQAGAITESGNAVSATEISAHTIDLDATAGISTGAAGQLNVAASVLTADISVSGDLLLANTQAGATTLNSLSTAGGVIDYDQTGGGAVTIAGAGSGVDSDITDTAGGTIDIDVDGGLTVDNTVDSTPGAGSLTIGGGVTLAGGADLQVGSDITLNGGGQDIIIGATLSDDATINLLAPRDIIVRALIQTTTATADINLIADSGIPDGVGGVIVEDTGQVDAGRDAILEGSAAFLMATTSATPVGGASVFIEDDGGNAQVQAAGSIDLLSGLNAPAGADVVVEGDINGTGAGAVTLAAADTVELDSDITTVGGDVDFLSPTLLTGPVVIDTDTGGGSIAFADTLDGTQTLDLTAGTGNINFTGIVGGATPLGAVTVNSALDVDILSAFDATSFTQTAGTGTTTIDGALTATAGSIDITSDTITVNALLDTATAAAGGTVSLDADTNALTLAATGDIDSDGLVDLSGAGGIATAGDVTTSDADISFNSATDLTGPVSLDSGAGAGGIGFAGTLDGASSLDLAAGTGNVTFTGVVGGATPLGAVTVSDALDVDIQSAFDAASFTQTAGTGTTTIGGALTATAGNIDITSDTITVNALLDTVTAAAGGTVSLDADTNALILAVTGDIDSDGLVDLSGAGGIATAGDVTTSDADISFNSATDLTGPVSLDSGAGGGNISLNDTVDATSAGVEGLTAAAGIGNVTFSAAVGGATALGDFLVSSASDVDLQAVTTDLGEIRVGTDATVGRIGGILTLNGDLVSHDGAGGDAGAINLYADDIQLSANGGSAGSITLDSNSTTGADAAITIATDPAGAVASATAWEDGLTLDAGGAGVDLVDAVVNSLDHLDVTAGILTLDLTTVGDGAGNGGEALDINTTDLVLGGNITSEDGISGNAGNIALDGVVNPIDLSTDVQIDADTAAGTDANVVIGGVQGQGGVRNLTLLAGDGNVQLTGAATSNIGDFIASGELMDIDADITAEQIELSGVEDAIADGQGGEIDIDAVTLTATGVAGGQIILSTDTLTLAGGTAFAGAAGNQEVIFRGETGASSIGVGDNAAGDLVLDGALEAVDGVTVETIVVGYSGAGAQTGAITVDDSGNLAAVDTGLVFEADGGGLSFNDTDADDIAIDLGATAGIGITVNGNGSITTLAGDLITAGGAITLNDSLLVDGDRLLDTTDGDASAAAAVSISGDIDGLNSDGSDTLTVDSAQGAVDGTNDAAVTLSGDAGTGVVVGSNDLEGVTIEGGDVSVHDIVVDGSIDISGDPGITLLGSTYTTNDAGGTETISFTGPVDLEFGLALGGPVTITGAGGAGDDISFTSVTDSISDADNNNTLEIIAGAGDVSIAQGVGTALGEQLGAFTITSANQVDINSVVADGAVSITGSAINLDGNTYSSNNDAVTFDGPVVLSLAGGTTTVTSGGAVGNDITFNNTIDDDAEGDTTLSLDAGTLGNIVLAGDAGGTTELGGFIVQDANNVSLQAVTTANGLIRIGVDSGTRARDTLTLNGDLVSHNGAGGDAGAIGLFADNILLSANGGGAGSITLNSNSGGGTDAAITIATDPAGALASSTAWEDGLTLDAGDSAVDLSNAMVNSLDHLAVTADALDLGDTVLGDGAGNGGTALAVTTINDLNLSGDILTAGDTSSNAGAIDLSGVGGDIVLQNGGAVDAATVTLTTDAAGTDADITLGPVEDGGGDLNLDLQAGSADVSLAAVGAVDAIGTLNVGGNDIAFNGSVDATAITATGLQSGGDDDSITTAAVTLDANGGDIVFRADGMAIDPGATLTSTGGTQVQFLAEADSGSIGIGDNAAAGATLDLSEAELQTVDATFSRIQVGSAAQSGTITVNESGDGLTGLNTNLWLNAAAGNVVIGSLIDQTATPGSDITVTAGTTFLNAGLLSDGGDIVNNGAVLVDGTVTVDSGDGGTSATAGLIQISGDIGAEGTGIDSLDLLADGTADGNIDLIGIVGGGTVNAVVGNPLNGFTALGAQLDLNDVHTDSGAIDITGADINLNGTAYDSTTAGAISFTGPVDLVSGGPLTVAAAGGDSISFSGTINDDTPDNSDLVLNTTGLTDLNGVVGGVTPIASITTDAGGSTELGANVSVAAGGMAFNDAVDLTAGLTLTTGSTTGIDFASTVDGGFNLVLADAVGTLFNGAVGGGTPLGSGTGAALSINSTGTTEFASTLATSSGVTQADGAGTVTFRDGVTLAAGDTASTFNADVILDGLTFTSGGDITFGNAGTDDLIVSTAPVVVDTSAANTNIELVAGTSLNDNLTLSAGGGTLTLDGAVDGNNDLTLNSSGLTDLNGVVGGVTPIGSITTDAGGSTELGADVSVAAGGMAFNDAVDLTAGLTLTTGSTTGIDFASTVDGGFNLVLADAVGTLFNVAVGGGTPLGSGTGAALNINSTGTTEFASTLATSSGVTQADAAGTLTFRDGVTLAAGDTASTFNADVILDGLTFTSDGDITFGNAATDQVTLSSAAVTVDTSATPSNQTWNAVIDGGLGFTVDGGATGVIVFNAAVGDTTPLLSFTVEEAGQADLQAVTANGGDIIVGNTDPVTSINVNGVLTTQGVAGGTLSINGGGITLNASPDVGATDIILNGDGDDIIIGADIIDDANIDIAANRDLIVRALIQALGAGDITLTGDNSADGSGGVIVEDTGQVDAGGNVTLTGSAANLVTTTSGSAVGGASVFIEDDGASDQILAGGTIDLLSGGSAPVVADVSVEGDITGSGAGTITLDAADSITLASAITSTGGDIDFADATVLTGDSSVNSGGGGITFTSTLDGAADFTQDLTLTAGAGDIDFDGAVGGTNDLGDVQVNSAGDVTADLAFNADSFVQSAGTGDTRFDGAVAINNGSGANVAITTNTVTLNNTLTTANGGTVTITNAGLLDIAAAADLSLDGAFLQDGAGQVQTAGNITTSGDAIGFASNVTLTDGGLVSLDTTNGAAAGNTITFNSALNAQTAGTEDLTLNAGTGGDIDFDAAVGGTRLGTLTVANAAGVTADAGVTAASIVQSGGQGSTTFTGAVDTNTAAGIDLTGNAFTFLGGVDTSAGGTVTIDNDGLLTIANGSPFALDGAFLQDSSANTGSTSLDDDLTATGDSITFAEAVTLSQTVSLDTTLGGNAGGASITFGGTVDASSAGVQGLTLDAGTGGNIDFDAAVGGTRLGTLVLSNANDVTADAAVTAAAIAQTDGQGTTTFSGPVNTNTGAGIDLDGNQFSLNDTVTITAGGTLTITNAGLLDISPDADMVLDGAFLQDGTGLVETAGDIATSDDAITFQSGVTLTDAGLTILSTGAGGGAITFNSTLDGSAGFAEDLTLAAGTGNIDFDGIVGGTFDVGDIFIDSAANVRADLALNADSFIQNAGTGNTRFDGAVALNASGGTGMDLTTQTVTLNNSIDTLTGGNGGTVTITNAGLLDIAAAADLGLDGAFIQDGAGAVQTAGGITTSGGAISFASSVTLTDGGLVSLDTTSGAAAGADISFNSTVDPATAGTEDLTLNAGTGGNIGFTGVVGGTRLGLLTLTNANDVNAAAAVSANGILQSAGQGTTTFSGVVDTDTGAGIDLNGTGFVFDNTVTANGGGGITLTNSGTADINARFAASGNILFDGTGGVSLDASTTAGALLETTGVGSSITISDSTVTLNSDVTLATNNGDLTLDEVLTDTDDTHTLLLTTGTGSIVVDDNIGVNGTGELAALRITDAGNVDFSTAASQVHAGQVDIGNELIGDTAIDNDVHFNAQVRTDTGAITVEANTITVDGELNTTDVPGAGGQLFIGSGVTLNVTPDVEGANIALNGEDQDTVITAPITENVPVDISAFRDVIIQNDVSTTGGNLTITANIDNLDFGDGPGGVLIDDPGSVTASAGDVLISGTSFTNRAGTGAFGAYVGNSIIVLADGGGGDQVTAGGDITLVTAGLPLTGTGNIIMEGSLTSGATIISNSIGSTMLGGGATLDAATAIDLRVDSNSADSVVLDLADATLDAPSITLTGGTGGGNDTLLGQDLASIWTLSGANAGSLANANITTAAVANYSDFRNLTGGTAADTFSITTGSVSGVLDGDSGPGTGTDTLDYSAGPAATINLTGTGSLDGFQGNATSIAGFDNINDLVGSAGTDTLVGNLPAGGTFTVQAGNDTYTSTNTLTFNGIEDLTGGSGNDTFNINDVHAGDLDTANGNNSVNVNANFTGGITSGTGNDSLAVSAAGTINGNFTDAGGTNSITSNGTINGNISTAAGNDTINNTGTITGNITDTGGTNSIASSGSINGNISTAAGNDTINNTGAITGNITDAGGTNSLTSSGPVNGNISLAAGNDTVDLNNTLTGNLSDSGGVNSFDLEAVNGNINLGVGDDTVDFNGLVSGIVTDSGGINVYNLNTSLSNNFNTGAGDETFNLNTGVLSGNVSAGGGNNTYNFNGGSANGTFNVSGDDTWNYEPGESLGARVIGSGSLTMPAAGGGDLSIGGGDLTLPLLNGFSGHFIVGGTLTPPDLPLDGNTVAVINSDSVTLNTAIELDNGGSFTMLGSNLFLNDSITAGESGPNGGSINLIAVGDTNGGSGPGDITAQANPTTLSGNRVLMVAENEIINAPLIQVELGGGLLEVALGAATSPQFGFIDAQQELAGTPETNNFLANLNTTATFVQAQILVLGNLIGLEQVVSIDTGLFEEDLSLFGVIGQGIALALAQCEQIEGCAPNVTPEELDELIAQLEGRVAEIQRRLDAATGSERLQLERLLAGYQEELQNFHSYRIELEEYFAIEEDLDDDAFADEFTQEGEGGQFTEEDAVAAEIQRLTGILEVTRARIAWLESLREDEQARQQLGGQAGMDLTLELLNGIIEATREQAGFLQQQIQNLLQGNEAMAKPLFRAEAGNPGDMLNVGYGPRRFEGRTDMLAKSRLHY